MGVVRRIALGAVVAWIVATQCGAAPGDITTYIGNGIPGSVGGQPGTAGRIDTPTGMTIDLAEFDVFIATPPSHQIRGLNISVDDLGNAAGLGTPGFSGDGGTPLSAHLDSPRGIAVNPYNNRLIFTDTGNQRLRELAFSPGGGPLVSIQSIAGNGIAGYGGDGGPALSAQLNSPVDVVVDDDGVAYVADVGNQRIRAVRVMSGTITTAAGSGVAGYTGDGGPATAATLNEPRGVGLDRFGNLYIADTGNHVIRRVDKATGKISTVVGSGVAGYTGDGASALLATLNRPYDVTVDSDGDILVADTNNHVVRFVDPLTGKIETIAGNGTPGFSGDGGPATAAQLNAPEEVTIDGYGAVLIADTQNHRVRRIEAVPLLLDHQLCFKARDSAMRLLATVDLRGRGAKGFFPGCQVNGKALELCVPVQKHVVSSSVALLAVNGAPLPQNQLCYKIVCGRRATRLVDLSDQFGLRSAKLQPPVKLCTPVGVPATSTTPTTTTTSTTTLPCLVDFIGSPLSGPAPLVVAFANLTTGCCNIFLWDFGDTTMTSTANPVHGFVAPGGYDVTLHASGPPGCTGMVSKVGYVTAF